MPTNKAVNDVIDTLLHAYDIEAKGYLDPIEFNQIVWDAARDLDMNIRQIQRLHDIIAAAHEKISDKFNYKIVASVIRPIVQRHIRNA